MTRNQIPYSWTINRWPDDVYPFDPKRARYFVRAHKDEMIRAGALVRVGRELVVIGDRFDRMLRKMSSRVDGYECAANKSRAAA